MPLAPFPLLGEPLSLDLVNTRVRREGVDVDLLPDPSALRAWLALQQGRVDWSGAVTGADLHDVRRLRDAITTLLAARRERARPPRRAVAMLNQALAAAPPSRRLVWAADGPRVRTSAAGSPAERLLLVLAADALTVLTGSGADLVRVCEHPDCVLQFVARHRNRRWCTAAGCGNRARVARHYARSRSRLGH